MNFKVTALASIAAIAVLAAGCKTTPAGPVTVEKIDSISATVTAIDVKKRLVSLRGPDGATATIEVPSDVRNLAQVKVGDKLVVRYYESIGAALRPKGAPPAASAVDQAAAVGRTPAGSKPGASVGSVTTTTVVIHSVDKESSTVTFTGPDGYARVLPVKDPAAQKFVATLKEGDQVDLTYTEALAVSVEAAK